MRELDLTRNPVEHRNAHRSNWRRVGRMAEHEVYLLMEADDRVLHYFGEKGGAVSPEPSSLGSRKRGSDVGSTDVLTAGRRSVDHDALDRIFERVPLHSIRAILQS